MTIDGPAGAGKSTAARWLADRLGFEFLDTGALYRAVTYAAVVAAVAPENREGLEALFAARKMLLDNGHVSIDGKDVSAEIRAPKSLGASGTTPNSRSCDLSSRDGRGNLRKAKTSSPKAATRGQSFSRTPR